MGTTTSEWRSKRLNRRCKFCKHLRQHFHGCVLGGHSHSWSECAAKDKAVRDNMPRPFCPLFEVNAGEIIMAKIPCPPVKKPKGTTGE